jgi:sugar porter (SP) family MFS transporter
MSSEALQSQGFSVSKVWKLAFNASWGSFIFGYNIGVFTSAQPSVAATLGWSGSEKKTYIMLMSSFMSLGAMFGALFSGYMVKRFGRRKSLMLTDLLVFISSGIVIIPTTATFAIGRLLLGFCSGIFACVVPLYINETAPLAVAGKVGGIVQLQVTLGIVISYALALMLPTGDFNNNPLNYLWMVVFAFQSIFALIQLLSFMMVYKHETPNWLIERAVYDKALESLKQVYEESSAAKILKRLEDANKKSMVEMGVDGTRKGEEEASYSDILLCKNKLGKLIRLGCMINFFQQFSGINAILNYSTTIFSSIADGVFMARVFTLIVGIVNMASTLGLFPLIEKVGRKKLIFYGGIGMTVCLFLMGFFSSPFSKAGSAPSIIFIMLFIFCFEASIGPICWIYCGEILPTRAIGICIFVNWFSAFIVVFTFPLVLEAAGMYITFFIFAGLNLLGTVYFCIDMVETKGLDKNEIRRLMTKS